MQTTLLNHGSLNALPKSTIVTAGGLRMLYENGFLRYISHGDTEIIRMINLTVRDHNWNTVPLVITSEKIEASKDNFVIEYEARCQEGAVDFQWKCIIHGKVDSTVTFNVSGKARSTFRRNRIGITVLHPIESCSGKDCIITHSDNTTQTLQFPTLINPAQPFFDIGAMAWSPSEGTEVIIRFEGEVFETEDQRNWLDVSYKTYCTPLSRPFPVAVNVGDEVNQSLQLHVDGPEINSNTAGKPITFSIDKDKRLPFPKVGIPLSRKPHNDQLIDRLKELPVDFLRVEVNVNEQGYADILQHAGRIASKLRCLLEVVLLADENTTNDFVQPLLPLSQQIVEFIILPAAAKCTDASLISHMAPLLRTHFPHCKIGGGTNAFFTELNRSRTPAENLDFLTFSVNPQVHAFDVRTMTENLQGHSYVMESCREFSGGKGIHVGPVTLKMRKNPNATSQVPENTAPGVLPANVDARQLSLFAAGWTMGSFKYLAENDAEAITYFQTCGWTGLMTHPQETWPGEYDVPEDCVYPVYLLLKEMLLKKQHSIMPLTSTQPLVVNGIAFADNTGKQTFIFANYTDEEQRIQMPPELNALKVRSIDAGNIGALMKNPASLTSVKTTLAGKSVTLQPFGLAFIGD